MPAAPRRAAGAVLLFAVGCTRSSTTTTSTESAGNPSIDHTLPFSGAADPSPSSRPESPRLEGPAIVHDRTVRPVVPGFTLGDYEPWQPPTSRHARGTVIARASREDGSAWLVEIDLASGEAIGRTDLAVHPGGPVDIVRTGDWLQLGAQDEDTFVWITYDSSLKEQRRVTLAGLTSAQLTERWWAFAADDATAVVVNHDGVARVYDAKGTRVAAHDCRPLGFAGLARPAIAYAGGLIVTTNLTEPEDAKNGLSSALCAFRRDGRGPTMKRGFASGRDPFVYRGVLYVTEDSQVRTLGPDLLPVGPPPRRPEAYSRVHATLRRHGRVPDQGRLRRRRARHRVRQLLRRRPRRLLPLLPGRRRRVRQRLMSRHILADQVPFMIEQSCCAVDGEPTQAFTSPPRLLESRVDHEPTGPGSLHRREDQVRGDGEQRAGEHPAEQPVREGVLAAGRIHRATGQPPSEGGGDHERRDRRSELKRQQPQDASQRSAGDDLR